MVSRVYKCGGKLFRYDFDHCAVQWVHKASKEEIAENEEWKKNHNGDVLFDIGKDGYEVVDTVGLRVENWKNKEAREEYLEEWCFDLDEELAWEARY